MWEAALLAADAYGLSLDDLRFCPARTADPYREVIPENLNQRAPDGESIVVNPHYRYGSIFTALLDERTDAHPELRDILFDILAHRLTELDLRSGLCRDEYRAGFLREDIEAGVYGRENAERLRRFPGSALRFVLSALLSLYRTGTSMSMFAGLLGTLYPHSVIYLDVRSVRELLIYVGKKKTPDLGAQLDLLCDLFVPADCDTELFWDMHFGLIGVDETMEIGGIMMY
jgi:hypothetical protein